MQNFLIEILNKVNANPNGHLELKYRVQLMKEINNVTIVNKIFFECVKYVFPIWKSDNKSDTIFSGLLQTIHELLYNKKGDKKKIETLRDNLKNYFEDVSDTITGLPGLSLLALCNSIIYDAEGILNIDEYNEEDDNSFDYDVWNPDFNASMAASGGNPFVSEGDINKRKQYWKWYLEAVEILYKDPSNPIIKIDTNENLPKEIVSFNRTQTYHVPDLIKSIQKVILLGIKDLESIDKEVKWNKLELVGECMEGGLSMEGFYYNADGIKNPFTLKYYLYDGDQSSVDIMDTIKYAMYEQAPKEGAWFAYTLKVNNNLDFELNLNYDDMSSLPEFRQEPDVFSQEFEAFPRSKNFTPEWLQNIVKKYRLKFI